jgi:signal peptidase I
MMKSSFSLGRLLAFILGFSLVFILWGLVFSPGGSGSNILLGVMLAVAGVYYAVVNLGPYFDAYFFHGGAKERAVLFYEASRSLVEMKTRLREILAKKKARAKYSSEALQKVESSLQNLQQTVLNVQAEWSNQAKANEHVVAIKSALVSAQESMKSLLGKTLRPHFLSGWDSLLMALLAALALRAFIIEPFQIPSGSMIPTLLVGDHLFVSKLRYGIINPFSKTPSYFVHWSTPKPGDVVVFEAPHYVGSHSGQTWIKRVIAGPGQSVRIENSVVYVDDKPYLHVTPAKEVNYLDYFGAGSSWIFSDDGIWREQEAILTREQISEDVTHDIYMRLPERRFPFEDQWPAFSQPALPGLTCTTSECIVKEGHFLVMGDNRGNSSDGRVWGALPIDNIKGKAIFVWMSVDGYRNLVKIGRFVLPDFRWSRWFTRIR